MPLECSFVCRAEESAHDARLISGEHQQRHRQQQLPSDPQVWLLPRLADCVVGGFRYATGSREERRFEAHKKYIDVQVLLEGEECIEVSLERDLATLESYDAQREVMFLKAPEHVASLPMRPGWFAILYPHDIHRPGCHLGGKRNVRKIVMKVAVE